LSGAIPQASVRTMAVLSVDLATRCWSDLGIVLLERARRAHRGPSSAPRGGPLARGLHHPARAAEELALPALSALTTCGAADAFGFAEGKLFSRMD
jgi:hypothetical protein